MTTPEGSPLGDAAEADLAEQNMPVSDIEDDTWHDADHIAGSRDWQASEADLVEQAITVPEDDSDIDR